MGEDLKGLFSEFVSKLRALRKWADRERVRVFEPILGEGLCDEVVERVQALIDVLGRVEERIRLYEREIADHLDSVDEGLRKLTESEEYRFLISERGMERLMELRERLGDVRSIYLPYTVKRDEVVEDG